MSLLPNVARVTFLAYFLMLVLILLLGIVFWWFQTCFGLAWEGDFDIWLGVDVSLCLVSVSCTNNQVFSNVVVVFFKSWKCLLHVKTEVFCKIFILVLLSQFLIFLARKFLKITSKRVSKTSQNRSNTLLVFSWLSRVLA